MVLIQGSAPTVSYNSVICGKNCWLSDQDLSVIFYEKLGGGREDERIAILATDDKDVLNILVQY